MYLIDKNCIIVDLNGIYRVYTSYLSFKKSRFYNEYCSARILYVESLAPDYVIIHLAR